MNLKGALLPALLVFVVYIAFSGSVALYDIITGLIVAVLAGLLFSELLVKAPRKSLEIKRLGYLLVYIAYFFLVAEVKAHLDVIKRILNPKLPINPGIVRVPYRVASDYSIVGVATSITNTPGTVVVDLSKEKGCFYVHWINVRATEPEKCREMISKNFERFLGKVFD